MLFPSDIKTRFGMAVRTRRKLLGFSQEELAERAGLHRTYVADVERGARNLSLANIEKLARALELSLAALFARTEVEKTARALPEDAVDILLVEDDARDAELTLKAFESASLANRIHTVRDGAEALEFVFCTRRYAERQMADGPKLILLDLKLPKVNGLDVLRQIKGDPRTRGIPVAVITGSPRQQDVSESLRLGAETCIVKPVDFQGLAGVVPRLDLCWALLRMADQASP